MKEKVEELRSLIKETSGTALTISPNEEGWSGYFVQRKKKIENGNFEGLIDDLISEIKTVRVAVELSKKVKKPWRY